MKIPLHHQTVLVDDPPAQLILINDFFASLGIHQLLESISWKQNVIRIYGKTHPEPRLTAWFGPPYRYSGIIWPEQKLIPELEIMARELSDLLEFPFNSVLCNYYRNGQDSMSWHADNEPEMDQQLIASVSLGAERTFRFRRKGESVSRSCNLSHGSLLIMKNFQSGWQHAVPKTKRSLLPRLNLTFRRIAR